MPRWPVGSRNRSVRELREEDIAPVKREEWKASRSRSRTLDPSEPPTDGSGDLGVKRKARNLLPGSARCGATAASKRTRLGEHICVIKDEPPDENTSTIALENGYVLIDIIIGQALSSGASAGSTCVRPACHRPEKELREVMECLVSTTRTNLAKRSGVRSK